MRLHSAIGYVTPVDKLNGQEGTIFKQRDEKLQQARTDRQQSRQREKEMEDIVKYT